MFDFIDCDSEIGKRITKRLGDGKRCGVWFSYGVGRIL